MPRFSAATLRPPRRSTFVIAIAALCGLAHAAAADIKLQSRRDFEVGSGATAFAYAAPQAVLLVSTADGLASFRREDGELVRGARAQPNGRGATVLTVGPFGAGGTMQAAFGGRDAARITVAPVEAGGGLGTMEQIDLPAPPRVAHAAPLGREADAAALLVATDASLSVIERRGDRWERREVAMPDSVSDFAVGDLTGDGRADLVVASDTLRELRVFRATAEDGFEPATPVDGVRLARRLLLVDANGDGSLDLLVLNDNGLTLYPGEGNGQFGAPQPLWSAPHLADLAAADLTGDGRVDLVLVDRNRAVVSVLLGLGDGRFALSESYLVGSGPAALQLADVDGDDKLDIVTLNQLGEDATILSGRGDGRFDGVRCLTGNLGTLTAVVVDDFNRDDYPDLAVASEDGGQIGVFLGRGDGSFSAVPPVAVGRQPRALVSGDFNQDENPDLAVVTFGADAVAILDGDGRGGFAAPRPIQVGTGPSAIGIGSFASDTSTDLAVINSLSNSVSVLYGDGRGRFPTVSNYTVAARPSFLIVGDTNSDGHQDLVVGSELSESVAILLGTGDRLGEPKTNTLRGTAKPSLAEDLDRDGQMDLINPDRTGNAIEILPGVGPGEFGTRMRVEVGRDPYAVASGDFDRDGRIDIVVATRSTQTLVILLNESTKPEKKPKPGRKQGQQAKDPTTALARRG